MNLVKRWWYTRVQSSLATILGAMAVVDLTPYAADFHDFIPWKHWHAALRLCTAAAIFWRARQVPRPEVA